VRRIRSIEGARGIAALAVVGYHLNRLGNLGLGNLGGDHSVLYRFGWLGVPLFFLLSGFLLFRPFAHALLFEERWPNVRRYARSRFLRIFPAYWVVVTLTIVEPAGLYGQLHASNRPTSVWHAVANYTLIYLPLRVPAVVTVAWTLCIEIAFYAVLPFFALGARRLVIGTASANRRGVRLALLLAPSFPISYLWLAHAGDSRPLPIWLPGYLDEFAIGMLLAIALELRPEISAAASRLLLLAGIGVAVFAGHSCFTLGAAAPPGSAGSGILFARLIELALALALASTLMRNERTALGLVLASPALVGLGTISYGIYLLHVLVIRQIAIDPILSSTWLTALLVLAVTLTLAATSWIAVERPALSFARRRERRRAVVPVEAPATT